MYALAKTMLKGVSEYQISYAQNREDLIIASFFPDVKQGFYIDVGANHPLYHSVTKLFYDKGWRGINFEPNPMLLKQIEEHRPEDKNLAKGLGDKKGVFSLRIYHSRDGLEGISTLSKNMQDEHKKHEDEDNKSFTDLQIEVTTLADSLTEINTKHVHFMKVDVEGFEYEVLKGNDWVRYRPELLCIESNHMMKDWRTILEAAKYKFVFNDGLNDYFLSEESLGRGRYFDYAKVFLLGKPTVSFEIAEKVRLLRESLELAQDNILSLTSQLRYKEQLIDEITPLRKHIKRQVKIRKNNFKRKLSK